VADIGLNSAQKANPEDLFYLSPLHEKWKLIDQYSKVVKYESEEFNKKYKEVENNILIGTAAAYKGMENSEKSSTIIGELNTMFHAAYYNIFRKKGKMKAEQCLAHPNPSTAAKVWNFLESKLMKPILAVSMTSAKVNTKIWIPKLLPELNLENIDTPLDLRRDLQNRFMTIPIDAKFISEKRKPMPPNFVPIRIICKEKLPYQRKADAAPPQGMKFDRVVIHFHGGGFVAMSTRSHQIYLRKWARHTNTVIFSVDYRLAPEFKYPNGLDDAWQAYYWLITEGEKQLGVKMNNVIVAGDSAGGNLAMSVTLRAIRTHFRVPDGLLLAYPGIFAYENM